MSYIAVHHQGANLDALLLESSHVVHFFIVSMEATHMDKEHFLNPTRSPRCVNARGRSFYLFLKKKITRHTWEKVSSTTHQDPTQDISVHLEHGLRARPGVDCYILQNHQHLGEIATLL